MMRIGILLVTILSDTNKNVFCFTPGTRPTVIRHPIQHATQQKITSYFQRPSNYKPKQLFRHCNLPLPLKASESSAVDLPDEGGEDKKAAEPLSAVVESPGIWPCFDELDSKLIRIAIPVIANFAISPLIGAVDLFWINRMGNALAVAGQSAANQVFNSAFWLASFLPSVTATFVSTENANKNQEGVQDAICQALFVGMLFAFAGAVALLSHPDKVLSAVLKRKLEKALQ